MSSGSKGTPGVWKARTGKKGVETMMTGLDKLKELTICCVLQVRGRGDLLVRSAVRKRHHRPVAADRQALVSDVTSAFPQFT